MGEPSVKTSSTLIFFVNGQKVVDNNVEPEWTLLYYLRNKLRLCGTKLGCAEGGCGACTVMVSRMDRKTNRPVHLAVNACLAPVCSLHGAAVTTVEGIGSTKTRLHPVQERIAKAHGSQCGFCTPGIVMSMYALLRTLPKPTMKDLEIAFQGNLCRCTGYRPILEGFRSFTEDWEAARVVNGNKKTGCGMGEKCCKNQKESNYQTDEILYDRNEFTPYDPNQEPIFPPELKVSSKLDQDFLMIIGKRATWYRPTCLNELLHLKSKFPGAKIVVGNTEIGVEVKFKDCHYPILIQPNAVSELNSIEVTPQGLKIGASVTITRLGEVLKSEIQQKPEYQTRIFKAMFDMLHWFAGCQIRNVAAIGGNIMTGSPISDLNPILMAANAGLIVESSSDGKREIHFDEKFFTGYRRNVIQSNELLTSIIIPYTCENQYFFAYKQSKRRDDDIAIVNCAANIVMKPTSNIIQDVIFAYGGMAPTTVIALKTKERIKGKPWTAETMEQIYSSLIDDLPLSPDAPGGMVQYRRALTLSFAFKVYLQVTEALSEAGLQSDTIPEKLKSAATDFEPKELKSSQYFQVVPKDQPILDTVGRPITHLAAYKQATGEAKYCDDVPRFENELYLSLVFSTRSHALIKNIDASRALAEPGVVAFFCHKDIAPERNVLGTMLDDEQVFYYPKVQSQSNSIGAVVAVDQATAQRAAKLVQVEYEDLSPVIITIEDAIKEKSFYTLPQVVGRGDINTAMKEAEQVRSAEVRIGGQEHFYLETHCVLAVPKNEDDEMEIFCSTQVAAAVQKHCALVLGIPANRIYVRVKRVGGAFGGKEWRANQLAAPVAFAAQRLGRPVRCMLDRYEDMLLMGGRHPFMGRVKVGFTKEGKITALDTELYNNAGCSIDFSPAVMDRAAFTFANAYSIPNLRLTGHVCKTNLPSNTAFRGFGAPQSMLFTETAIREVAYAVGKPVEEVIRMNLITEGGVTHFNQKVEYCTVGRCFEECLSNANYDLRRREVAEFNKANRYKKRGIGVLPTMYGIAFTALSMNQATALIHIYTDGSVLLTHGGVEVGQGLHTKMIQIASRVLGVPSSIIHIYETATDKIPNASPTAGSVSSDLFGMAVIDACQAIANRLVPYREKNPEGEWVDWVRAAHFDRVCLSATGFFKTTGIGYDPETNTGKPYNYFAFGAGISVVEIDCLTGSHQVLRTDIVMDVGESLNPAIDIGQIEGAFTQGMGLYTTEELVYSPTGSMYTRGPGMYKIPAFGDIPAEFNVSLLRGAPNPRAVYSSKGVGEPPLFLACSVYFGIKEAIMAAREEVGLKGTFRLDSPATAARIRMACEDDITKKFPEPDPKSYQPWNVVA